METLKCLAMMRKSFFLLGCFFFSFNAVTTSAYSFFLPSLSLLFFFFFFFLLIKFLRFSFFYCNVESPGFHLSSFSYKPQLGSILVFICMIRGSIQSCLLTEIVCVASGTYRR